MYTIKQAGKRSGLSVPTIRAWERRYGVVRPARTPSGYRLYDDEAITRLTAMQQLVDVYGMRPSQASLEILSGGADIAALAQQAARGAGPTPGVVVDERDAMRRFLAAAAILDVAGMDGALDAGFAAEGFEAAVSNVVFPALRAIGVGWSTGELDVAMEHAASETVRRRLARFFDAAARGVEGAEVVVGLPPGAHHEIGALAFAVAARRGGLDVLYLGADVPVESWSVAMTATGARVAVLGVVSRADIGPATEVIAALRAGRPAPIVAVGGAAADDVVSSPGLVPLADPLEGAVRRVRELLTAMG
jgi:methanogenic corrinoid protein MtbC1